jgi:predicted lipid-binding transport protein (Tim44 family)
MRVEVDLARLHLTVGEETIDFGALARAVEVMTELTGDFVATVRAWIGRVSDAVARIAEEVRTRVRRLVAGTGTVAKWIERKARLARSALVEPDKRVTKSTDDWPPPADLVAEGLNRILRADPSFDASHFIEGARTAFEMIVAAFAKSDKGELRPLLSDEVFQRFAMVIDERLAAKETLETHIERLNSVDIVEAGLAGRTAQVTLKLVSHQINVTRAMDGSIVDGASGQPVEKTDYWTFARDTRSTDPNWVLVATSSG